MASIKKEIKENDDYKSIRVKESTKKVTMSFLEKVNGSEFNGKVTYDDLITYFIKKSTALDIENLQLAKVTWIHEERRLRRLYEKKKGKISEEKWKRMLCFGELVDFFNEHSRLPIG